MTSHQYKPRLCQIHRGPKGFGFHLHGEKGKFGQVIRKIEPDSPAFHSNLKQGDRVVAVNGKNVETLSHQEVVARIKEISDVTALLVVDEESDRYFQENDIPITEELVLNGFLTSEEAGKSNDDSLRPRLCHLERGSNGFGFNLHSDKTRKGRYIRAVDENGPSAAAGLLPGDRVIEVNNQNMEYANHQDVVAAIKESGSEVDLLVVSEEADGFFQSCGVTPTAHHLQGPLPTPLENPPDTAISDSNDNIFSTSNGSNQNSTLDLMTIDLTTLKEISRRGKKKSAPSSNWNNRQAIFNNL